MGMGGLSEPPEPPLDPPLLLVFHVHLGIFSLEVLLRIIISSSN